MNIKRTLIATLISACGATATPAADTAAATANATNTYTITGMHCDGCAGGLTAELKLVPGVASAQVTFSNKLAVVAYDTNKVTTAKLNAVIKEAGFTAKPVKP